MKLELKNIKHTAWASEETHCYQASLYVDGKPVAVVCNDGHGGCDRDYDHPKFKGDYRAVMKSIEEYFESLPPSPFSYEGADGVMVHDTLPQTLEAWCCDAVNDWLSARELRRMMRTQILFQKMHTLKDSIVVKMHRQRSLHPYLLNRQLLGLPQ